MSKPMTHLTEKAWSQLRGQGGGLLLPFPRSLPSFLELDLAVPFSKISHRCELH